jgi:hypothetical protein
MIEVSERTRSGCSMATAWAIMPPIEAPTTWALSKPRASSRPTVSAAMSDSVYDADDVSPAKTAWTFGRGASWRCVERPTSRLSKRTTKRPRSAMPVQNSSGHPSICVPRPMTSSSGGSPRRPNVS